MTTKTSDELLTDASEWWDTSTQSGRPCVIDVAMQNEPVPTFDHWNIMDIYSPGKKVHHVSTGGAVHA